MRALLGALLLLSTVAHADAVLLNASYDPTRELYQEVNALFAREWQQKTGERVTIAQSHEASGKQARAVIEGLPADVVTLALPYDIDAIATKSDLLPEAWRERLPDHSTPYTSTIVFVVRRGNPKGIHDWSDLVRPGTVVTMPNPKISGGARWVYLAAYGYAMRASGGDEARARDFVRRFYRNAPIMDSGSRAATTTFAQRRMGDVLVSWENEAFLVEHEFPEDGFEIIRPSVSIVAETPVALLDKNVAEHGTRKVAQAYLQFLYRPEVQELAAKHHFRPVDAAVLSRHPELPAMKLFTVEEIASSWQEAHRVHFSDGGVFDSFFGGSR
ncbi:MAG: sulfate ABC transporter substrate-binding protein [Polyangia bacterium]